MRSTIKKLAVFLGADRLIQRSFGGIGAILMFHRVQPACAVSPLGAASLGDVAPDVFVSMLDHLRREKIDIVPLAEAQRRMKEAEKGRRFVSLTFDDGYRDNHEILWPILREHQVPATIYVTPGFIDRTAPMWWYGLDMLIAREKEATLRFEDGDCTCATGTPSEKQAAFDKLRRRMVTASEHSRNLALACMGERYGIDFGNLSETEAMTWDMVRELAASSLVEIGAHTLSHPPLSSLDTESALREISGSKQRLESEIGKPVQHFAFPYGDLLTTGRRETELAARAGFASATTTHQGAVFPAHAATPHALPRFSVGAGDCPASLSIKLSGMPVAIRRPFRPVVMEPLA